jgi:hypothetical protein
MSVRPRTDHLGQIAQSDGSRGPTEATRAVWTMRTEVVAAISMTVETTAMKIVGMCQTGLRNVETIVETTTTIVETTVVDTRVGLGIRPCGGPPIPAGRRSSSCKTVTAITNAMANGSAAPITAVR